MLVASIQSIHVPVLELVHLLVHWLVPRTCQHHLVWCPSLGQGAS